MAKKNHTHLELSNRKCSTPGCERRLKLRIVEINPDADKCYKCHQVRLAQHGRKHRNLDKIGGAK